jgi:cytochrome P450
MGTSLLAANTDQNWGDRSALCWSTAAGISWFVWLLSRNRHVEDSIRAEIAEIVRSRNHHHRHHHDVANNKKDTMLDTTTHTTTAAAADGELQKGNSTIIGDWEKYEPAAAAAANPNIDMITSSKFTYEELKKMHYLDAAMTESMRLYPPVPFDPKLAMEEDTWPDGTHIPKDSVVAYAPYAMGRMEQLWGSDCLQFKQER